MEAKKWKVVTADCVEYLKTLPENSVDSCVCDPPYGLEFMSKDWDKLGAAVVADVESEGGFQDETGGNPYSRSRARLGKNAQSIEAWHLQWATEVFRVLKPGGHLLAFGATRTYHRLACAVEDAGFEIRDTIDWVYGNGFPKNFLVAKAIDEALGVKPTKFVPNKFEHPGNGPGATTTTGWSKPNRPPVPLPESDKAKEWAGWGTALKPAHEPIVVARKPLIGSVADNVLAFGTGAINVNANRIGIDPDADSRDIGRTMNRGQRSEAIEHEWGFNAKEPDGEVRVMSPLGRWPTNFVFSHDVGCRMTGSKSVPRPVRKFEKVENESRIYGNGAGTGGSGMKMDDDVTAIMDEWSCVPWCPVAELERQGIAPKNPVDPTDDDDADGKSRFFPQFGWGDDEVSFAYSNKASKSERYAGLDLVLNDPRWPKVKIGSKTLRCRKCGQWEESDYPCDCPEPDLEEVVFDGSNGTHLHPTVKPLALMRWLVRLVTPPGGTVLDPFTGSGTTGCAAVVEGFTFLGIEKEPSYVSIAEKRIAYWKSKPIGFVPMLAVQNDPSKMAEKDRPKLSEME